MSADHAAYTAADVRAVRDVMLNRHAGAENAATTRQIAGELGLRDDRKLRAVLADFDGEAMLLGKCAGGIFLVERPEDAASLTAELVAKTRTLEQRIARRDAYAAALAVAPVRQLAMVGVVA